MLLSLLSVTLLGTLGEEAEGEVEVEDGEEGRGPVDSGYAQTPTNTGMTDMDRDEAEIEVVDED